MVECKVKINMVFAYHRKFYRPWATAACRHAFSSRPRFDSNANQGGPSSSNSRKIIEGNFDDDRQNDKRSSKNRFHDRQSSNSVGSLGDGSVNINSSQFSFDAFMKEQIDRARRSLLVRFAAPSPNMYDEAYAEICRQLRTADISLVPSAAFASAPIVHSPDGLKTFFLLETTSRESLDRFVHHFARSAASSSRMQPCRTRILHYTGELNDDLGNNMVASRGKRGKATPGTDTFTLNKALKDCLWIDEQMRVLVDETMLTEYGVRLRFFVASFIEDAFRGIFPNALCTPFGSTTNGFGHASCDLDMDFAAEEQLVNYTADARPSRWLCAFRVKDNDHRQHTQRMIELIGRMARTVLPYCADVARIIHARVPIVKMTHEAGGFGCDITVDNVTGPMCAKILWVYSRLDSRACPLLFAVRRWAASCEITRETPGEWLTNFQLLCLVVYFLQTRPSGFALPSIGTLRRLATSGDYYGIIGDAEQLSSLLQNEQRKRRALRDDDSKNQSLGDLLREFFHFYGNVFPFDRQGINLETGSSAENTSGAPLFIPNPLEEDHNIGKNVTPKELERFRTCAKIAVKLMERKELMQRNSSDFWGLLTLFDSKLFNSEEKTASASLHSGVLLADNVKIDIGKRTAPSDQSKARQAGQKKQASSIAPS